MNLSLRLLFSDSFLAPYNPNVAKKSAVINSYLGQKILANVSVCAVLSYTSQGN